MSEYEKWEVCEDSEHILREGSPIGWMEKDCAALAAAAPDLLAALQFIVNDAEPGEDAALSVEGYNRACAAIAKAKGA